MCFRGETGSSTKHGPSPSVEVAWRLPFSFSCSIYYVLTAFDADASEAVVFMINKKKTSVEPLAPYAAGFTSRRSGTSCTTC
jgi:hypothetical protein